MISFVIQGPYFSRKGITTCDFARKLRAQNPGCEIIFSTWEGTTVDDNTVFDQIIYNTDPGPSGVDTNSKKINADRQILSTKNGLNVARNDYCVKLRSDCVLQQANIFELLRTHTVKYPNRVDSPFSLVNEKIIVSNVTTKLPEAYGNVCLHLSDWFFFGLKRDLLDLLDTMPFKDSEYERAHDGAISIAAEQHLIIAWLKKHKIWKEEYLESLDVHRHVLQNNFVIAEYGLIGLRCHKFGYNLPIGKNGFASYSHYDFVKEYTSYFSLNNHEELTSFAAFRDVLRKSFYRQRFNLIQLLIRIKRSFKSF